MARVWLWLMVVCPLVGIGLLLTPLTVLGQEEAQPVHLSVQKPPDPDRYPEITITVRITDENEINPQNLTATNFTLTIVTATAKNGGEYIVKGLNVRAHHDPAFTPLNLVIAVDRSILIDKEKIWPELRAVGNLAKDFISPRVTVSFVVFSNVVMTVPTLEGVDPDKTTTALHRAIALSLDEAAKMQDRNSGEAAVIVLTDRHDNSQNERNLPPPLSWEELQALVASNPHWKKVKLYIYGYGADLKANSPHAEKLKKLARKEFNGHAEFELSLPSLHEKVLDRLHSLNTPEYDLYWRATQPVNQTYTLTITVSYTDKARLTKSYSATTVLSPTAHPFIVTLDPGIAGSALVTPASTITVTATATGTRSPIQSVDYQIADEISPKHATTDNVTIFVISRLAPGPNTLHVTMTDQVGNVGQEAMSIYVAQALTVSVVPTTQVVTQREMPTATFWITAGGEPPITLTPRIWLAAGPGPPPTLSSITLAKAGSTSIPITLAQQISATAQQWITPAPECWPQHSESLGACLQRNTQVAWTNLVSITRWITWEAASALPALAPACPLHLVEYSRCVGEHEKALWATLTDFRPPQPPSTHNLDMTVLDSKGQKMVLTGIPVIFNYEKPGLGRRLFPHRYVLLADLAAVTLLWLLGWWLWRRYKAAHLAQYTLHLKNAGNTPCAYDLWAVQPASPSPTRRNMLVVQPAVLAFTFSAGGKELSPATQLREQNALTLKPQAASGAASPSPTRGDRHYAPYEIHQPMNATDSSDPYAIAIGQSPRFVTPEMQPGESMEIDLLIRPRRRHWRRRNYTFEIYSEPKGYGAGWKRESGLETIRFGGLRRPVRIDQIPSAAASPASSSSSQTASQRAASVGAG